MSELPEHLQYLAHLTPDVLKAIDGTSQMTKSIAREDLAATSNPYELSKVYDTAAIKDPLLCLARGYTEQALVDGAYKPERYLPRLFGRRITLPEDSREARTLVNDTAAEIYAEIDRIFMPTEFEYRDGGLPGMDNFGILRVITWIPMELVPLPQTLDYAVRVVMNVEYHHNITPDLVDYLTKKAYEEQEKIRQARYGH